MKRLAAGVSITGLALMTSVASLLCGSSAVTLETRIALFLSGVALFVAGGAGYNAMAASLAPEMIRE